MPDDDALNPPAPTPPADPPEEMIPKSLMLNRLAEKERVHAREISKLKEQLPMTNPQQTELSNLGAQAAHNVVAAQPQPMAQPAPMMQSQPMQQAAQPMQQQAPQPQVLTPEMAQDIAQKAIQAHMQQQAQLEQQKKVNSEVESFKAAQQNTIQKIQAAAADDKEFKSLIENTSGFNGAENLIPQLANEPNAPQVMKKLLSSPENLAKYQNSTVTDQDALLRQLAKEVHTESMAKMAPTPQSNFASRGGSPTLEKDPKDMDYDEYREWSAKRR